MEVQPRLFGKPLFQCSSLSSWVSCLLRSFISMLAWLVVHAGPRIEVPARKLSLNVELFFVAFQYLGIILGCSTFPTDAAPTHPST